MSWKLGFRRAEAGCAYKCPWWADEMVYGLASQRLWKSLARPVRLQAATATVIRVQSRLDD
jgi:hypothetical protein